MDVQVGHEQIEANGLEMGRLIWRLIGRDRSGTAAIRDRSRMAAVR